MSSPALFLYLHRIHLKPEGASLANLAVNAVIGFVQDQDLFDDGKAQAAAVGRADVMGAGLVVPLPYVADLVRGDAGAVVDDLAAHLLAGFLQVDDDDLVLAAVFYRVVDQIGQDLLDSGLVAVDDDGRRRVEPDVVALLLHEDVVGGKQGLDRGADIKVASLQLDLAGLHAGHVQHVVDQYVEPVSLVDDHLQVGVPFLRNIARQIADHLRVGFDHGQRRAKVVRHVGDQVLLIHVRLFQLPGGVGQGICQFPDLRIVAALEGDAVVALSHLRGRIGDVLNRL